MSEETAPTPPAAKSPKKATPATATSTKAPTKPAAKKTATAKPAAAKPAATKAAAVTPAAPVVEAAAPPAVEATGGAPVSVPSEPTPVAAPQPEPTPFSVPAPPAAANAAPPVTATPARMLESEARTWSTLIYVLALVLEYLSAGTLAFLVPLVIWLVYRDRSALVDWHGKQSLNLHLTSLVVVFGGILVGIVTLGIGFFVTLPLMLAYLIYVTVVSIIAAIKSNAGEYYRIPMIIRFIR